MITRYSVPPPARRRRFPSGLAASVVLIAGVGIYSTQAKAAGLSAPAVGHGRSSPELIAPSSVFWNPGALGFIDRPKAVGGANLIIGSIRYQREYRGTYQRSDSFDFQTPISPADVDPAKSGFAPTSNHVVLGPQPDLFIALPIKDTGLVAGFGLYAPYVATVNYPKNGAQRFHIQDALILALYLTPSLSYKINDNIAVGGGVSAVIGYAQLNRMTDFASLDLLGDALEGPPVHQNNDFGADAPVGVRELDVLARPTSLQQMLSIGVTFNVGTMIRFDRFRLGLSYNHAVKMNYRGKFRLDMNDDFFTGDLASQGLQYDPTIRGDASLSFTLPNAIHAGVGYDVSRKVGVGVAFSYMFWSRLKAFDVVLRSPQLEQPTLGLSDSAEVTLPREWMNAFTLEGFIDYRPSDVLSFYGSLGFLQNAVPDTTIDASSPDGDRISVGGGVTVAFSSRYDLTLDAKIQHTLPRRVVGSDHDLGNGRYGLTLVSLGAHIGINFGPMARATVDMEAGAGMSPRERVHADVDVLIIEAAPSGRAQEAPATPAPDDVEAREDDAIEW